MEIWRRNKKTLREASKDMSGRFFWEPRNQKPFSVYLEEHSDFLGAFPKKNMKRNDGKEYVKTA